MDCLSVFNPLRHLISSFIYFYLYFFLTLSFLLLFQIWLQERLQLLQPPTVPLSTYLLRRFRDCRLHQNDMIEAYMELMGHLKETDI